MAHSRKQEVIPLAQRPCCCHPIRWWRHRIILSLQDQRRNAAPDWLLLDRRRRFHPPELADRVIEQVWVEQCRSDHGWQCLRRCLQIVLCQISHIFATLGRIEQSRTPRGVDAVSAIDLGKLGVILLANLEEHGWERRNEPGKG